MELKLYNTLTRTKEAFEPLDQTRVRMYVCGPTVYDFAHIGNARPLIVFDVLYRLLRHLYGPDHVKYVRNVTDVDDKINTRASEEYPKLSLNRAIRKITIKTEAQFHKDVAALRCLKPTVEPRATKHIKEMKSLIRLLIKAKRAYVLKDHVLFKVKGLRGYGKLSHRKLSEMRKSERGEVAPKRDPMDFVLWKPSKVGEPAWPSPAGIKKKGRPGWHIECSAMSWKYLGKTFDIHGGGIDLVFPHHENEIAQSRCAFHTKIMAQVWMHNGFLQVEGEKMSKSQGNFVTIRSLLDRGWSGETIRLAMLSTHYRQPINWTEEGLREAERELDRWYPIASQFTVSYPLRAVKEFIASLCDDLNTPAALGVMRDLYKRAVHDEPFAGQKLRAAGRFLGLFSHTLQGWLQQKKTFRYPPLIQDSSWDVAADVVRNEAMRRRNLMAAIQSSTQFMTPPASDEFVEKMITLRRQARLAKNFAEADRIRDELAKMGVILKDNKDGTTSWEVAR